MNDPAMPVIKREDVCGFVALMTTGLGSSLGDEIANVNAAVALSWR